MDVSNNGYSEVNLVVFMTANTTEFYCKEKFLF